MAQGRRGGADSYRVLSGGAGDPRLLAGEADPSAGGGVSAPEGSLYLRYTAAAGQAWWKSGAGDTAWTQVGSGGGGFGTSGQTLINTIRAGDVESHDSATPLIVSQFAFDPSEYVLTGCTRSLVFRAVAANGGGVAQTKARVYNLTDGEYVGSGLTFVNAAPTKQQETLTIGAGAGEVDDSEKLYEVHIWVVAPGAGETIELGSAELRMINTIN